MIQMCIYTVYAREMVKPAFSPAVLLMFLRHVNHVYVLTVNIRI